MREEAIRDASSTTSAFGACAVPRKSTTVTPRVSSPCVSTATCSRRTSVAIPGSIAIAVAIGSGRS